jgi:hypothetical protein
MAFFIVTAVTKKNAVMDKMVRLEPRGIRLQLLGEL